MDQVEQYSALVDAFLDIGEAMLATGAEINRTEDTLMRLGRAYGAKETNVFVITSFILVTMKFELEEGEKNITHSRRIFNIGTDFTKLDALNQLSRECAKSPMSIEELKRRTAEIKSGKSSSFMRYAGSALAAGGFAVFFGGTATDALAAGVFGLLLCFLQAFLQKKCPNKMLYYFICSLISGLGIYLVSRLISGLNADIIIIGDIMLLVPGKAITTAARDILLGDNISGIMKLIESLFWTGALAGGFMLAIRVIGG